MQKELIMFKRGDIKKNINTETILLFMATICGALILFIPIDKILLLFLALIAFVFFIIKPEYCYYLIIFTIPFTERLRFLPISFSLNDILIFICSLCVLINVIVKDERIDLKTKIDKWILVLLILYFTAGIYSINDRGILTSFKFLEAILTFYMTVYFIRSKKVKITQAVTVLISTALLQASLGIFQSTTGIGATFRDARGVLGYLGLGSNMVWHGMGTMGHFNTLGNFLVTILIFFAPIYQFILKNKKIKKIALFLLITSIIMTYSRGSLIGIYFSGLLFLSQVIKNKKNFITLIISSSSIISALYFFLKNTSYIETVSNRTEIWTLVLTAIFSDIKYVLIGGGLNSYMDVVGPYLPINQHFIEGQSSGGWFAHNYYLLVFQQVGIIGFIIQFAFFIFIFFALWNIYKQSNGLVKAISLSVALSIFSTFFISTTDHTLGATYYQIVMFVMFGLVYANKFKKNKPISNI